MVRIAISLLTVISLFASNPIPTINPIPSIEMSFLQNSPKMLYTQFASKGHINISFPEPISFSDQISNQQAFFLFHEIFSSYTTLEFFSERHFLFPEGTSSILKARWSFKDNKNNNQYVFHIFFFLIANDSSKTELGQSSLKISEIKAEKI